MRFPESPPPLVPCFAKLRLVIRTAQRDSHFTDSMVEWDIIQINCHFYQVPNANSPIKLVAASSAWSTPVPLVQSRNSKCRSLPVSGHLQAWLSSRTGARGYFVK